MTRERSRGQDLDGHVALQSLIVSAINDSHTTGTYPLHDPVVTQHITDS
jgi:hypothetical protein